MTEGMATGVDGCRAGWLAVRLSPTSIEWRVLTDFEAVIGWTPTGPIAVDIPIGLPTASDWPRACDVQAKRLLGSKRGSSVFPVPCREALECPDYASATALSRERTGKAFSRQLWMLRPKILEVDALLLAQPRRGRRVLETHPELVFWRLDGDRPVLEPKRKAAGFARRREILLREEPRAGDLIEEILGHTRRADVARDDIVDAIACALAVRGAFETIPEVPPEDVHGLPLRMVVPAQSVRRGYDDRGRPSHRGRRDVVGPVMRIPISELEANLREYLNRVRAGEEVVVTDRGRPVARLTGVADEAGRRERLEQLVRLGRIRPPLDDRPALREETERPSDPSGGTLEALLEERREGR